MIFLTKIIKFFIGLFKNKKIFLDSPIDSEIKVDIKELQKEEDMTNKFFRPTKELVLRGNDPTGFGHFGASRSGGKRKHNGTDYCVMEGEEVYAVISGKVRIGYPYTTSKEMKLIEIVGQDKSVKIMYVNPVVDNGQEVKAGQLIGFGQNVAKYWKSKKMKNHIHVEVRIKGELKDPEKYIF